MPNVDARNGRVVVDLDPDVELSSDDRQSFEVLREAICALIDLVPPADADPTTFAGAQFDAGLAWIHHPTGLGGLDMPRRLEPGVRSLLDAAGAPDLRANNVVGYGMAAPTLLAVGSEEQCHRHLREIFTCESVWCQLYSEPGAGSDLAGLSTRAERDGDVWVVNGQKVWTSYAHAARYGLLLARTDSHADKYSGLTYFILDMSSEGIDVRPLRQLTGDAEFNEIFLEDVRVSDHDRLGAVGDGWRGALATLTSERATLGAQVGARESGPIAMALELWRDPRVSGAGAQLPARRDALVRLWIRAEVLRMLNLRRAATHDGRAATTNDTVSKLAFSELSKEIFEFCTTVRGPEGMLYGTYEMRRHEKHLALADDPAWMFLRSRSNTIAGGTSEIIRNVIAERILGLPGDIRVDKGIPWVDVPR